MLKVFFSCILISFSLFSQNIKTEKLATNLGVVWGMTFVSENKLLFTIKSGEIGILNLDTKEIKYLKNSLDLFYNGQGGLLDVKASPNFNFDRTLYFTYVKEIKDKGVTTLAKAKLKDEQLYEFEDVLVTKTESNTTRHFGSRITFDENGHLFFSVGDRGVRPKAQELSNHAGTIIRLNLDGTIPRDNPFVNKKSALPEIYSYGHRNPQGIFYDKTTNHLWSIEHGPRGGDEINLIEKGLNYGWPVISYGKEYWNSLSVGESTHKKGMQQPVKYYVPSIAPSSLIVYRGLEFPKWNGNILSGALKLRHINRVVLDNNKVVEEQRLLEDLKERIRNIIQSSSGVLFISTDRGNIYKLTNDN